MQFAPCPLIPGSYPPKRLLPPAPRVSDTLGDRACLFFLFSIFFLPAKLETQFLVVSLASLAPPAQTPFLHPSFLHTSPTAGTALLRAVFRHPLQPAKAAVVSFESDALIPKEAKVKVFLGSSAFVHPNLTYSGNLLNLPRCLFQFYPGDSVFLCFRPACF